MSLENAIATATQEVGLARQEILGLVKVAQTQIAGVGAAFLARVAGLQTYFFINPITGIDTNAGTAIAPLKTLGRALELTPFGGYCEAALQADYTVSAKIEIYGRTLHLRSDAPAVKRNIFFERLGDATYRWPASFNIRRRAAVLVEGLTVNVPDIAGYGALTLAGNPGGLFSSFIDGWSAVSVAFSGCNIVIPANPFCPIVQGSCLLDFHAYASTFTGAVTSFNGRLSADQTNTAGVASTTLSWLRTNLATV